MVCDKEYMLRIYVAYEAGRLMFGVVDVDERLSGSRHQKGKRESGACGEKTVFGIFERDGQVQTEIVPVFVKAMLLGIKCGKVGIASVLNFGGWRRNHELVDLGYGHFGVDYSEVEFAKRCIHIEGVFMLRMHSY